MVRELPPEGIGSGICGRGSGGGGGVLRGGECFVSLCWAHGGAGLGAGVVRRRRKGEVGTCVAHFYVVVCVGVCVVMMAGRRIAGESILFLLLSSSSYHHHHHHHHHVAHRLRAASRETGGRARAAAANWPVKGEDLGGYSRAPSDDSPMWELLLEGIRVCDDDGL